MTRVEDERRTEHLIVKVSPCFLQRLSEIPHSAGQKQKGLSVSCLAETADWFQPSDPNIDSSFKGREGQAGLQAKTCTETGGGTWGIQGQPVWDNE